MSASLDLRSATSSTGRVGRLTRRYSLVGSLHRVNRTAPEARGMLLATRHNLAVRHAWVYMCARSSPSLNTIRSRLPQAAAATESSKLRNMRRIQRADRMAYGRSTKLPRRTSLSWMAHVRG